MIDLLATTTCWDVLDDAVKIGLGALIGGGFAWLLAKQKYSQDVKKEDRKYSQEIAKEDRAHRKAALEQLAVEFEQIHEDIWVHALPGIDNRVASRSGDSGNIGVVPQGPTRRQSRC